MLRARLLRQVQGRQLLLYRTERHTEDWERLLEVLIALELGQQVTHLGDLRRHHLAELLVLLQIHLVFLAGSPQLPLVPQNLANLVLQYDAEI